MVSAIAIRREAGIITQQLSVSVSEWRRAACPVHLKPESSHP